MTETLPPELIDWKGNNWTPETKTPAAHPNARFTAPAAQCPVIDPAWEDPKGVPVSAILFGGRRLSVVPLVHESFSWNHGVFIGSIMASEMTAAASGIVGKLRRDPFAMLPFCGYHMGDYFKHWISIAQKRDQKKLPKIYYVNWFRKTAEGKWLWPGYGENSRVLKWVIERVNGTGKAVETPIGSVPAKGVIDVTGLSMSEKSMEEVLKVDVSEWKNEIPGIREHFATFGDRLPGELTLELEALIRRLG
jgi:phosphoenolpyruvate carboxykinase (GTP)